jgi:hypothetical protein
MTPRWDETWHRLREWTNGQGPSERLAAQILISEGFASLDPSHPLGGPDGGKDALCKKGGKTWIMAVYFPRGQQSLGTIKSKFCQDLAGVAANGADALAFVTNQEFALADRRSLVGAAGGLPVELYHLERNTAILDAPAMASVRKQFLGIGDADEERLRKLQTADERGAMRALVIHLDVLREQGHDANVSGSWRSIVPHYDVSRIDDLLPSVPSLTGDRSCCECIKTIHYWVRRPGEPHAARMVESESERLLVWLRARLDTP